MSVGTFDENNIESWYFGSLSFDEAKKLLETEATGIFLVRDSSRTPGEYVLCLKESNDVQQYPIRWKILDDESQYFLRDDFMFPDIQSMLSFYKGNKFQTTSLIKPIGKEAMVPLRPKLKIPQKSRASENLSATGYRGCAHDARASAPPTIGVRDGIIGHSMNEFEIEGDNASKVFAKVIKNRTPSAYDAMALRLSVGDLIQVTEHSDTGQWIGIINGKKGTFPFSHVEIISEAEYLSS